MPDRQQKWEITVDKIIQALAEKDMQRAANLFVDLHLGDQVEVFSLLGDDERDSILDHLNITETAHLFSHQEDSETLEAAEGLSIERLADVLDEMEPDEAADLLGDLPKGQATLALEEMEDTDDVLTLLPYSDNSAGGRMTTDFISTDLETTTAKAIDYLRLVNPEQSVPYYIFVKDDDGWLAGVVGLRELVVAKQDTKLKDIMDNEVMFVSADTDQEMVAQEMARYDLSALPVVNERKQIIGVITHDDILDVLTEEATEDIYRLANVIDAELEPESSVKDHLKGRLPWLFLNTFTALFAAWVISNFESLIAQVAVLAVFQSVVAGQGGNAGSQSVAMMVRAIALGKVTSRRIWHIMTRALTVGLLQGLAVGMLVGVGVMIWRGNSYLGLVIGLALVGNMLVAAIAGTIIPLGLDGVGLDPALASSVLVTAITDSLGFFIFLSLASIFLANLL